MTISRSTAARAALVFTVISVGGAAVAQGAPPAKKPTVGGKPIVQAKPSAPMGCKLIGTVKSTKIWAGDCVGAFASFVDRPMSVVTQTKRPPDRPTVLSLTVGVDALDFAFGLLTLPLWDWSLIDTGRCENLIAQTQL